jgi:PPP family 3-phenylpropionic acid transporter
MLRPDAQGIKLPDAGFGLRLSVFYIAIFFIVGCYMPFLPVWLRSRALTDEQISLIYAVPVLVRAVFTPAMTFAVDRSGQPVKTLIWLAWGSLLSVALLRLMHGFAGIFATVLVFTLFWMSVIPITDSVALAGAGQGLGDYGRMRLWGSVSYIAMTSAGGAAVQIWGPPGALWLFVGAAACVLASVYWLPGDDDIRRAGARLSEFPLRKLHPADILQLVRIPDLWLFLAATGALQSAHAVYYIFGTLHWTAAGIQPVTVGTLWGIGVIAEVVLFGYGARVNQRFGPVELLAIAGAAAVFRWTITAYDPPLPVLFLAQALHGLTFGAAHLGAMHFLNRAIPLQLAASAQGLYAAVTMGIVMGTVSLAAGILYRSIGSSAYLAMAGLGALGLLLSLILMRRWQRDLILSPTAPEPAAE